MEQQLKNFEELSDACKYFLSRIMRNSLVSQSLPIEEIDALSLKQTLAKYTSVDKRELIDEIISTLKVEDTKDYSNRVYQLVSLKF